MKGFSLMAVIASITVAGAIESVFPYSECRWDKEMSLDCSSIGITVFSAPGIRRSFWPHSVGLQSTIKHINLSNNTISRFHLRTLYNYPLLETLNLSNNNIYRVSWEAQKWPGVPDVNVSAGFLTSLKTLLLSGNRLKSIPDGLGDLKSLQTLRLSANRIQLIHQDDFANCTQLRTIDLGDNGIYKIHPDAFRDTKNLQLLSLRSNAMMTITSMIFTYIHVMQAEVDLSHNPWACDCRMLDLKHFISIQYKNMDKMWNVTCNSPPSAKGQHLITMDFPLTCEKPMNSPNVRQELIVAGKKTLLPCDVPDSSGTHPVHWWTPKGWVFEDDRYSSYYIDHMKNLVLTLPDRADEGEYICVSDITQNRILYQVYVHTGETAPIRRSRSMQAVRAQWRTQKDFTVAVCLSVIISFICAFCLGLFARPFIEHLWRKHCKPRCSKKQNSKTVYDNEGFTDERRRNSTSEIVTNHRGKNISAHTLETESSSGSSITASVDQETDYVSRNHLAGGESQHPYHANPTLPKSEENSTKIPPCFRDVPTRASSQPHRRRGTYTITDENDQSSDKEIVTPNDGLQKTKEVTSWNPDVLLYENDSPQLNPNAEAAAATITDEEAEDAPNAEIVKSAKHKQLFPSTNSDQSPYPHRITQEGAADYADVDMPTAEIHKPLHTKHSGSVQKKQYLHRADVHMRNGERATSSDTSSTDDGSFFSFSISSSLYDTTDFLDLPSDDEKVDPQLHSTAEVPEGNMMPSHASEVHTSDSSSDLSTPTISRQTTPTPIHSKESEIKQETVSDFPPSQSNQGTDIHLPRRDLDASNQYDKTDIHPMDRLYYYSDTLSKTSSSSNESEGNSEVVIIHDQPQQSNNTTHTDKTTNDSDLSTSSESAYDAKSPVVADAPHHLPIQAEGDTDAGHNPYKTEAVLRWLETATSENPTNESLVPSVRSNTGDLLITTSEEDDLLNINPHEEKTMQTTAKSSDNPNITQRKTYTYMEYDANTNAPFIGLDLYTGGSVNPLPTMKPTDESGAYFVKKRKVFDAFSASLNTGEVLI